MGEAALTPMGVTPLHSCYNPGPEPLTTSSPILGTYFYRLLDLLEKGLAQIAAKITGDIKADFHNLGSRIKAIENKLDITVSREHPGSAKPAGHSSLPY